VSPEAWERRLAKRGLRVRFWEHGPGYVGDCVMEEWTAVVEPMGSSRNDIRFRPLIGLGQHLSRDAAVKLAVARLEAVEQDMHREIALLALAGEPQLNWRPAKA
jgi:hypothetical protein